MLPKSWYFSEPFETQEVTCLFARASERRIPSTVYKPVAPESMMSTQSLLTIQFSNEKVQFCIKLQDLSLIHI